MRFFQFKKKTVSHLNFIIFCTLKKKFNNKLYQIGKKQFIDKFVEDSKEYDYEYNDDDYYYTVENVQTEDLRKYENKNNIVTSTPTRKLRKHKVTKTSVGGGGTNKVIAKEDKLGAKLLQVSSTANTIYPSFLMKPLINLFFIVIVNKLSFSEYLLCFI